ncbi:hypothetical protein BGZ83_003116, partial [Gryganskiella cystojenkinii]
NDTTTPYFQVLQDQIARLSRDNRHYKEEIERLRRENQGLHDESERYKKQSRLLKNEVVEYRKRCVDLSSKNETQAKSFKGLKKKYQSLEGYYTFLI